MSASPGSTAFPRTSTTWAAGDRHVSLPPHGLDDGSAYHDGSILDRRQSGPINDPPMGQGQNPLVVATEGDIRAHQNESQRKESEPEGVIHK